MSQLTSRGLDNTSSAFVSDIYIYPITLNGYIYSPGKKNRKNKKKIEKIKKIEKNKKCSEQFLGPLPGP